MPRPGPLRHQEPLSPESVREQFGEIQQLWAAGRRHKAAARAKTLYSIAPQTKGIGKLLCRALFATGKLEEAFAVAAECFERFQSTYFLMLICRIRTKQGRGEEALNITGRHVAQPKPSGQMLLCHGSTLLRTAGDLDASLPFFQAAARTEEIQTSHRLCERVLGNREFEALTRRQDNPDRNPIRFLTPCPSGVTAVVATSADEPYFRALWQTYRDSFLRHNSNPHHILHLHLFDPSPALLAEAEAIARGDAGRIGFSCETTGGENRSYYYAGRFVQVPRLLKHYGVPIIMTDVDCTFLGGVEPLLQVAAAADLGLLEDERHLHAWVNFLAGMVVFGATEAAYRFALGMHHFLLSAPKDTDYWYMDQLALMQCAYLNRNLGVGKIEPIAPLWRRLASHAGGSTGEPQVKAATIRRKTSDQAKTVRHPSER